MTKQPLVLEDYIKPLDINGMAGRMLHLPAPAGKSTEILFVYGQHSSLERWFGVLTYLHRFGAVTAPDLPGMGGMDSFDKIGKTPSLDNFADYLAALVKLRYRRKKVAIVGLSFGFVVATRMLQRYPELAKHVTMVVSLAGFTHADDFALSPREMRAYRWLCTVCSYQLPAWLFRHTALRPPVLRAFYARTPNARSKFATATDAEMHARYMAMEVSLWRQNDIRTHAVSLGQLLRLNNCAGPQIDVPLWHISIDGDQYLDRHRVEQHLHIAYRSVHVATAHFKAHAPSLLADESEVAQLIPSKVRRALGRL